MDQVWAALILAVTAAHAAATIRNKMRVSHRGALRLHRGRVRVFDRVISFQFHRGEGRMRGKQKAACAACAILLVCFMEFTGGNLAVKVGRIIRLAAHQKRDITILFRFRNSAWLPLMSEAPGKHCGSVESVHQEVHSHVQNAATKGL